MKPIRLLKSFSEVKDSYVISAEEFRQGKYRAHNKSISAKRAWLIAAIIMLLLLLVGCTVTYFLRMQDMQVGEYQHYISGMVDSDDNGVSAEGQKPITLISLQGTHMEALAEWIAFVEVYDSDHMIAVEAESIGNTGNIPEQYYVTYGCYTQEMVDKLEEIVEKYELKLLSSKVQFAQQESSSVLQILGLEGVCRETQSSQVKYLDGYYYPEGTFELNMTVSLEGKDWQCTDNLATYRFSRKEYFDPVFGAVSNPEDYTQWDYTRQDGNIVLLAMNDEFARIYIDLPDAFISVSMEACEWEDGGVRIPMTKTALEQIAELLDLNIQPQPTGIVDSSGMTTPVKMDVAEYAEIVEDYIVRMPNPDNGSYLLYDLNSDGVEELLINGWGIYSMQDGVPYEYIDLDSLLTVFPMMRPCEGNIVEIYTQTDGAFAADAYYFYRAEEHSISYIVGVTYDNRTGAWTLVPDDDPWTENDQQISETEAQQILDSYSRVDCNWRPIKKYGEPYALVAYTDPYAKYISEMMDRYEEAADYQYLLMDLNGDGTEELITRDHRVQGYYGQELLLLNIYTIENGELKKMADGIDHICEGGILEETEEHSDPRNTGEFWRYSRCTENGVEFIERIVRDPTTLVWGRIEAGKEGRDVTEEEAMSVVNYYRERRLDMQMKPFSEYPMQ